MANLKPVRGTQDILPEENRLFRRIEEAVYRLGSQYGYEEISTPIFESTEVFARTLGDTTDVVTKEMYTFEDRNGDSLTLRPEGTAGVARAFLSNGLAQHLPLKYFYRGPMFRRERPQKGRRRQFHQVGVELLGVADAIGDVEIIALADHLLSELGINENIVLELNTLGDGESRQVYRDKLVEYFEGHRGSLSEDSLRRLENNPLRILDSKDEADRALVADAPIIDDCLNETSKSYFEQLCTGLDNVGVSYKRNPRLVRGFDYYCHTAFEFVTDALGAQGTVLAGGRYDGLIGQMAGNETPGTGWAAGVERLSLMIEGGIIPTRPIAVIPIGSEAVEAALTLTNRLRRSGYTVDLGYSGNLSRRMKRANKLNARAAILIGEDELARNAGTIRDMDSGDQNEVSFDQMDSALEDYRG